MFVIQYMYKLLIRDTTDGTQQGGDCVTQLKCRKSDRILQTESGVRTELRVVG